MTVREFFRTVWDGKYLVAVTLVVVLVAAFVYLDRQEEVYEATATVQLREADAAPDSEAVVMTVDDDPDLATGPEVERAAAAELGTDAGSLTVTAATGSEPSNVTVTARGGSAEEAVAVANTVAAAYVAHLPAVLDAQLEEIDSRLGRMRDQYRTVKDRSSRSDALAQTELTTIEGQYQVLVGEQQMLDSIRASEAVAVVATPADTAVSLGIPPATVLALGVLAGLLAGIGVAFARRGLDFRVRGATQAGELTGLPVLAELSGVKSSLKDARATGTLPISSRTASPFTESIRELRTALHVALPEGENAIVLVTATDPAAPRSFIAANLAASWALSGRRTAILQADMRRPELDALLPPPAGWDGDPQAPRPTRVPQLEVVPVPHVAMDPADYLATDDARALVDGLRERAEIVVIDAPPVLAAADATILGGYADSAVLIATVGRTDRVVLSESADRLRGNNVPLAGVALSGVKGDRRTLYASVYDAAGGPPEEHAPAPAATAGGPGDQSDEDGDGDGDHGGDPVGTATVRLPTVVAARAAAPARGPHWPRVTSTSRSSDTVALGPEQAEPRPRERGNPER
ncbi:CpsD/CapB family tyrosine-protein kinase [Isoptericola sp. F-RaC21]|uniref:CpsD/CapB family tyrosine-protein kinase n=1 Tax=Isoptericola sp. F-RaC21 TaxID=3141452 RepID=UPI00315C1FFD